MIARAKPLRSLSLVLAGCLLLAACHRQVATGRAPEPGDKAVAQIGDQTIWASDVKREAVAIGLINQGEALDLGSPLFRQALSGVIDRELLAAEARRRNLDQSPAVQRRLADARDHILQDVLMEQVLDKAINPNSINGLYQEQLKRQSQAMEFKARQIITASQAEAEDVRRTASQRNADFAVLAAARSIDAATRFDGGELGYFTADVMPEAYGAALKDAKPGDVVGPFQTAAGWVVLKLEDKRPEPPMTLEAARPQIVKFLTYDEVRELVETVRKGAKVKMLLDTKDAAATPAAAPGPESPLRPAQPPATSADK